MNAIINKLGKKINGNINIPGDKSISIRAALISNIFNGDFELKNFNFCDDTIASINAMSKLSKRHSRKITLDCKNSATTMRLLSGMLVSLYQGEDLIIKLIGDASLSKRPMDRILIPLKKMGADIKGTKTGTAPLIINCKNCHIKNLNYVSSVPSAQVKSCLELASFCAGTKLNYKEPVKSRDHTKIMLDFFSMHEHLDCHHHEHIYIIPSDISTASYFIANAIIYKGSNIKMKNILMNPTRNGFINTLTKIGVKLKITNKQMLQGEKVADIALATKKELKLKNINISAKKVPSMIDEIMLLVILLTTSIGKSTINGINELRYKESDRVNAIENLLKIIGVNYKLKNDTITISGNKDIDLSKVSNNIKDKRALKELLNSKDHRVLLILKLLNIKGIKYKSYLNTSL